MSVSDNDELRGGAQSRGLTQLEHIGFDGAPRFLGYDEQGRQVLSYVPGTVPDGPPLRLSDARIISATHLIRDFHDRTATSALRGTEEVVCHGDLGPFNTVFDGDVAVALIDFGEEVAPGTREADFAHAVWCFADLTEPDVPLDAQIRTTALMCSVYPGMPIYGRRRTRAQVRSGPPSSCPRSSSPRGPGVRRTLSLAGC